VVGRLSSMIIDRLPGRARRAARSPEVAQLARNAVRVHEIARHYLHAVAPTPSIGGALRAYPRYLRERRRYAEISGEALDRYEDNPQLLDWSPTSPFDPHYTYQDAWAARAVAALAPERHVDVGSRVSFATGLSAFVPVTFIDLRPLEVTLAGLECREGSLLDLPFGDGAVASLSCLHVAEHVGLGRYGDPLDPMGTRRAAGELARVLAPDGQLLFGLPVGRPRTNFNAHRVHDPREVVELFAGLTLASFAAVDDSGRFHPEARPGDLVGADWGCGLYRFTRA